MRVLFLRVTWPGMSLSLIRRGPRKDRKLSPTSPGGPWSLASEAAASLPSQTTKMGGSWGARVA